MLGTIAHDKVLAGIARPQANFDVLKILGASLCYAVRQVRLKGSSDPDRPMPAIVLYLIGFPVANARFRRYPPVG